MAKSKNKTEASEKSTSVKPQQKGGIKVEFVKSPTGLFKLGYNIGDIETFDKKQAEILIDSGVAKKA